MSEGVDFLAFEAFVTPQKKMKLFLEKKITTYYKKKTLLRALHITPTMTVFLTIKDAILRLYL